MAAQATCRPKKDGWGSCRWRRHGQQGRPGRHRRLHDACCIRWTAAHNSTLTTVVDLDCLVICLAEWSPIVCLYVCGKSVNPPRQLTRQC